MHTGFEGMSKDEKIAAENNEIKRIACSTNDYDNDFCIYIG